MKKVLLVLLTFVLAFSAFACGETYTEVPEEDYAETLTEFVGEENELTVGITNNVRIWMKETESDGTTTEGATVEMIYTGTGENLKVFIEMKEIVGTTTNLMIGSYITDGYIYAQTPNWTDPEGDPVKVKVPYSATTAEMMEIQNAVDALNAALERSIHIDPSDAEFLASIGKLEISGNKGGDRKLRMTVTETDEEYGITITGTITIAFNKDNKVVGLEMNATETETYDGETTTSTVEMKIEACSNITFPSLEGFLEE